MWYDKYYNKIARSDEWYFIVGDTIYPKYDKVISVRNPGRAYGLRWYEYYKKDGKFVRVTKRDRYKIRTIHFRDAKEKYSDYFVKQLFGVWYGNRNKRRCYIKC